MNVNLLIIDDNFTATNISSVPSKPDEINKGAKFTLYPDDKHSQVNSLEKPTTYNFSKEIQKRQEPVTESQDEFTQSIHKKEKSENIDKSENKTKPEEQSSISDKIMQPNELQKEEQNDLTERLTTIEQDKKEGDGPKIESKAGRQLAQTITNTPTGKPASVTGHAVKSSEIKLLHATEKGQLGLKTILPAKSNGLNGLKAVLPNTSESTPASKKQTETGTNTDKVSALTKTINQAKSKTENRNTTESVAQSPANTGKNANESIEKPAIHTSSGQAKDQNTSTSNKNLSQGFEQMLSHNSPQIPTTEQTSTSTKSPTTNITGQNAPNEDSANIGKQILESVQRSISQQGTDQQITIRLNPPELGKVLIKFQQHNSELTGLMEVNKIQTRFEIEQTLPQIIRNLADAGINIKRIEVMLSNEQQSGQGTLGNQSLQSGGSQQQYSGNPGSSGNNMDVQDSNEWLASNNSYQNTSELQEMLIADNSIDMLV